MTATYRRNPKIKGQLRTARRRALEAATAVVGRDAQRRVPVRTGTLKRSMRILWDGSTRLIVYGAYYARFVHDGTRYIRANPWLRRALDASGRRAVSAGARASRAALR